MNSDAETTTLPRWAKGRDGAGTPPTAAERAVLAHVLEALRRVRHGSIVLAVQDGRVVQVDVTEKQRL